MTGLNQSYRLASANQFVSIFDTRSALQEPFAGTRLLAAAELLESNQLPRLETTGPAPRFRIVLMKPPLNIGSHSDVVPPVGILRST
jgi:hypothetical protein